MHENMKQTVNRICNLRLFAMQSVEVLFCFISHTAVFSSRRHVCAIDNRYHCNLSVFHKKLEWKETQIGIVALSAIAAVVLVRMP